MLLRCTTRLLKLMGSRAGVLQDAKPGGDDWYANVFIIERRKCLLLVHAAGSVLGPTDPSDVQVAKSASRSVVGHMNEITFEAQHLIAHSGGLQYTDLDSVNRRLRRGLHGRGGEYVVPLELAAARSA